MSYFPLKTREKTYTENGDSFLYNKKPNKMSEISNFFSKRIITNDQLITADTGLYTWILRNSGNFFASKTITKQEVGTLHLNLKSFTDSLDNSDIYAAGELELIKEENYIPPTIIFNLLSGSFMIKKFVKLSNSDKLNLRNEIVRNIQNRLLSFGIPSQFLECSMLSCSKEELLGGMKLIENANIRTSSNNLNNLNKMFLRRGGNKTRRSKKVNKTRRSKKMRY